MHSMEELFNKKKQKKWGLWKEKSIHSSAATAAVGILTNRDNGN